MGSEILMTVDIKNRKQSLGDMFGIFFEDLNHAADGGLYGEMVRNRSFEFDVIDNKSYNNLTAWKVEGLNEDSYMIETESPVSVRNPHYLTLSINQVSEDICLINEGYNSGFYIESGKKYNVSLYMKAYDSDMKIRFSMTNENGQPLPVELCDGAMELTVVPNGWSQYRFSFAAKDTTYSGRLKIRPLSEGKVSFDHISMFPEDTFLNKENGLRADIAQLLKELKPKFLRFPGGCLVHDGSLNADDRDSMYRWKNTIGNVIDRPARRSNWGYNQTLGLGYYEYFCFSEEIGAKPLPVLPGGYNPHRQAKAPLSEIGEWVDEALDLIEFANGGIDTKWGKIRAELGHDKPFNLEYIAIGNEEVGEAFFERYPYFHKAIKEKYPDIKIIGTSGPFAAGGEFDRGWTSAIENKADLVDEHYYMSPEWFLAHINRYSEYKEENPKVFLGEYATWGNTYYNALVEAAYMTRLQENAHSIGLACYAPLLCNADYVNWKPDMIWFNNHQVYGTANYYVQKMFMHHQGNYLLDTKVENVTEPRVKLPVDFSGDIELEVVECTSSYSNIQVCNDETGEIFHFGDKVLTKEENKCKLMSISGNNYTITLNAKQVEGKRGFWINFGKKDDKTRYYWELGGWQNLDAAICQNIEGRGSCHTQSTFSVDFDHIYELKIKVSDSNVIEAYVDGKLFQTTRVMPVAVEELYVTSSVDEKDGDIIVKCVNINEEEKTGKITLAGIQDKAYTIMVEEMKDFALDSENSFEEPKKVCSDVREINVASNVFKYTFPRESVTVLRVKCR